MRCPLVDPSADMKSEHPIAKKRGTLVGVPWPQFIIQSFAVDTAVVLSPVSKHYPPCVKWVTAKIIMPNSSTD